MTRNFYRPIAEFPDEAFAKVLLLNLQRVFTLTQKLLPMLEMAAVRTSGSETAFDDPARVINIGSVDGLKTPAYVDACLCKTIIN